MDWVYITLTWLATLFVANEIGLGRMNPWIGLFVFAVLVLGTMRAIYRLERKTRVKKNNTLSTGKNTKRTNHKVLIIGSDVR